MLYRILISVLVLDCLGIQDDGEGTVVFQRYFHVCTKDSGLCLISGCNALFDDIFVQLIGKVCTGCLDKGWTVSFFTVCIKGKL